MKKVLFLISFAVAVLVNVEAGPIFTGYATAYSGPYNMDATGHNACNLDPKSLPKKWQVYYGALSFPDWNGNGGANGVCQSCIRIRGIPGQTTPGFNIEPVVVMIVDQCAGCAKGSIDLSTTGLAAVTGYSWDKKMVNWEFWDCNRPAVPPPRPSPSPSPLPSSSPSPSPNSTVVDPVLTPAQVANITLEAVSALESATSIAQLTQASQIATLPQGDTPISAGQQPANTTGNSTTAVVEAIATVANQALNEASTLANQVSQAANSTGASSPSSPSPSPSPSPSSPSPSPSPASPSSPSSPSPTPVVSQINGTLAQNLTITANQALNEASSLANQVSQASNTTDAATVQNAP
jgi:hypothetical protein